MEGNGLLLPGALYGLKWYGTSFREYTRWSLSQPTWTLMCDTIHMFIQMVSNNMSIFMYVDGLLVIIKLLKVIMYYINITFQFKNYSFKDT